MLFNNPAWESDSDLTDTTLFFDCDFYYLFAKVFERFIKDPSEHLGTVESGEPLVPVEFQMGDPKQLPEEVKIFEIKAESNLGDKESRAKIIRCHCAGIELCQLAVQICHPKGLKVGISAVNFPTHCPHWHVAVMLLRGDLDFDRLNLKRNPFSMTPTYTAWSQVGGFFGHFCTLELFSLSQLAEKTRFAALKETLPTVTAMPSKNVPCKIRVLLESIWSPALECSQG